MRFYRQSISQQMIVNYLPHLAAVCAMEKDDKTGPNALSGLLTCFCVSLPVCGFHVIIPAVRLSDGLSGL